MENNNKNSVKNISINNLPKPLEVVFWLLPVVVYLLFISSELDNDFYFLYPTGEYIVNNGFPVKDFLTWHGNMDIIVQQWLSTVIFYYIYHYLGIVGTTLIQCVCVVALYGLFYKLLKAISDNYAVSQAFSAFFVFFVSVAFIKTRPQMFTYLLIVSELLALETYINKKQIRYLFVLPVISVLLVNLHSAMWMMLFVFMLPYFAQSLPIKIKSFRQEPCADFVKLLITAAVSFAVGFINPYGIKAMLYIFTSYGLPNVSEYINEMAPISFNMSEGKFLFALVLVFAMLFIRYKRGRFELRFVLLTLGTLVLSLSSGKSLPYFYISAGMLFASYFKEFSYSFKIESNAKEGKTNWKKIILVLLALSVVCGSAVAFSLSEDTTSNNTAEQAVAEVSREADLDPIIDYLKAHESENIVLFNSFNSGPYLEFNGIKTFIDARAELYFKKNNHEADYFDELFDFESGEIYYKDFVDEYGFTHLIVQQKKYVIYNALINDEDYTEVIHGANYSLFVKD